MSKKQKRKAKKNRPAPVTASRGYEAAQSTPARRHVHGGTESHDAAMQYAHDLVRNWGRYLDENHDLAVSVLDEITRDTIGSGIRVVPKPMRENGEIDVELGKQIAKFWKRFSKRCDVTGELSWMRAQRVVYRSWKRDGDVFAQHVDGASTFPHIPGDVPYRFEILESEMIPVDFPATPENGWRQGIQRDTWRRPINYAVYLEHPGDMAFGMGGGMVTFQDVKIVPANRMLHLKNTNRWPATRGVSVFAALVDRLYGIKDLEESERIKNRVLASWTAAIKRSPDTPGFEPTDSQGNRFLQMAGGTVIDTLAPGEELTGVGPEYPVAGMPDHIADQVRRVAAGAGVRYSAISKRYEGSYSAERQQSADVAGHADMRRDDFVSGFVMPVYERWAFNAVMSNTIAMSPGMDLDGFMNADYLAPPVPWIDGLREIQTDALAVEKGFQSQEQIQIKRGASPELIASSFETPERQPVQLSLVDDDNEEDDDEEAA